LARHQSSIETGKWYDNPVECQECTSLLSDEQLIADLQDRPVRTLRRLQASGENGEIIVKVVMARKSRELWP